ncbi:MAG: T9SS type A sorting domain-containing protein [Ignavibacteriales bacterium]|jgi:hypothetical protein|nr:T9SS type A sorting domain-containing protein [Ignavibacteriales bacterium]MBK8663335.1 T9SS type A sorting domain-containing protein [Ignavibacteriales bacterium]MBP7542977.1 T9SS type A sorting domain-containing protein [Ignavibacteriaceae bacterium]
MFRYFSALIIIVVSLNAQTPVYINLGSHNEVTDPILYDTDSVGFMQSRSYLIELANIVVSKNAKYNFQADWRFLQGVINFDKGNDPSTNGKNVLKWLSEDSQKKIQVDAHSHQSNGYNYADVAQLISNCGVSDSKIVGGFLWNDTLGLKSWLLFENGMRGEKFPLKIWKPDIVWGSATKGMFHNGDLNAFGSWRPAGAWNMMTHDPSKRVRLHGNACHNQVTDSTEITDNLNTLNEMLDAISSGRLPAGNFYTATIMFNQRDFSTEYIQKISSLIDSLNVLAQSGKIVWGTVGEKDSIWRNEYGGSPHFITCDNYLTSIDDPESTPETIEVGQNYPNPFNPSTVINYSLAEGGNIFFRIYDIQGREVATILDEYREAGHHSLMIDAAKYSLNSGVYFYCLSAGGKTITRKMVLLK